MMIRKTMIRLVLVVVALVMSIPAKAVLKEANIDSTLAVLRTEMSTYKTELTHQTDMMQHQQQEVGARLMKVVNQSNQNSLMLYSQKAEYVFDLTYACHEATAQYHEFRRDVQPFRQMLNNNKQDIARYDSLIINLSQMYTGSLSERGRIDRSVCLTLAINIRRTLKNNNEQLQRYIEYYNQTEQQLKNLDLYANKRYEDIQQSIFSNTEESYFTTLSRFKHVFRQADNVVKEKYLMNAKAKSQWSLRYMVFLFLAILIYGLVAVTLNFVAIRWLVPKKLRSDQFVVKRTYITMATSVVTLALILGLLKLGTTQNFIIMASGILVEYFWLLGVILISLLLRLDGDQIQSAFRIYSPVIVIGLVIITFRVVLIPNAIVNLILPPLILLATLWQWNAITRLQKDLPRSDKFTTYITLAIFAVSCVASWMGYTLLAVQILIWWLMQLTCSLTIICFTGWLTTYAKHKDLEKQPITKTWFFNLVLHCLLPILSAFTVVISLYWATDVFNLSDLTMRLLLKPAVDTKNFSCSLMSLLMVVTLFFVFRYINTTTIAFIRLYFERSNHETAASRLALVKNLLQVTIWGIWIITTLNILHVSNTWIVVVSGGLSTGIGFAMKDILENIYYGISLMAGRVKIGDYIVVDNIRGKVSSISYTSTMLEAIDGSVIAFQNSQLFTKNYKNMTKNHGYELDILEVGVAYGTNIKKTQRLLEEAIGKLDFISQRRPPHVVLKSFDDSAINLKILVWVPVLTQYYDDGRVLECVYDTLNQNHIEIPFPQREVRLIHASAEDEDQSTQLDSIQTAQQKGMNPAKA